MAVETHAELRWRIWVRDQGVCGICSCPIISFDQMDLDRIVPRYQGGKYADDNVRASHGSCNRARGGRDSMIAHPRSSKPTKQRVNIAVTQSDREAVKAIRQARKLDSDGAAIRYAVRVIAEQERAKGDRGQG